MREMITGQYIMGDSIIHCLDPRTKLIGCLVLIVVAVWPRQTITILLLILAFIIIVIYFAEVGVGRVLRGLRSLKLIFLLTFICQVFLTRGDPLWSWGSIVITRQGIDLGINTFLRLLILFLSASLLTMTTSTLKISAGLESLLSPLKYLRFPVQQFAMIINIALRFIPTITEEAEHIVQAQKSRGAQFDSGSLSIRLRTVMALLIPLLAASLQRATDLAWAMESRCYTSDGQNYSRVHKLHFAQRDLIAMGVISIVLLLAIYSWKL